MQLRNYDFWTPFLLYARFRGLRNFAGEAQVLPEPALERILSAVVIIFVIVKSILRPAVPSIVRVPLIMGTKFSIVDFQLV